MQRFSLFLFGIFCLLLTACGDGFEQVEEADALGFREVYRVDPETGLRQGKYLQYNPDGSLFSEAGYLDDELHGERIIYHDNGEIDVVENYERGEFSGDYTTYAEDGTLLLKGRYSNGAMNKAWTNYYRNGNIKSVVTFVDNQENGPFREWYENGQPLMVGNYLDGDNIHGTLHRFDSVSGKLNRVLNCEFGRCNTTWTPDSTHTPPPTPDMTRPSSK